MSLTITHLARAYFHQDYGDDSPDPVEILTAFAAGEGEPATTALVAELREALTSRTEEELAHLWLDEADAYFEPPALGMTHRTWFLFALATFGGSDPDHAPPPPFLPVGGGAPTQLKRASTFVDIDAANAGINALIQQHTDTVEAWLAGTGARLALTGPLAAGAGRVHVRELQAVVGATRIAAVLARTDDGFRVHTTYPEP